MSGRSAYMDGPHAFTTHLFLQQVRTVWYPSAGLSAKHIHHYSGDRECKDSALILCNWCMAACAPVGLTDKSPGIPLQPTVCTRF